MPDPSSLTRIEVLPAPRTSMLTRRASDVEGVLDQLLDHRRGALDHLARCDGVSDLWGEQADRVPHDESLERSS